MREFHKSLTSKSRFFRVVTCDSIIIIVENTITIFEKSKCLTSNTNTNRALTKTTVQDAFRPLLEFVADQTQANPAEIPIVLKATAGLRAIKDKGAKESVMRAVREVLKESKFQFEEDWARIIPGNEEGGLAWVAANYLSGTLRRTDRGSTSGVIEMGGGSSQVTFEVSNVRGLSSNERYTFQDLKGRTYNLYAYSYLGFGQDYARTHYYNSLSSEEQSDPCCYPGRVCGDIHPVFGSGNFDSCEAHIRELVFGMSRISSRTFFSPSLTPKTDSYTVPHRYHPPNLNQLSTEPSTQQKISSTFVMMFDRLHISLST